jgi:Domain of unknown function (DUF4190)
MTYPPAGGTPDPYQPQQPYGQGYEPTSGQPGSYGPPQHPTSGQPGGYPPPPYPTSGQPGVYGTPQYPTSGQPGAYGAPQYATGDYGSPQPYGPSPYGPPGYGPYGPPARTNGLAIASLVCSLAGLITCISAPVGVVLGHLAKRQIRETGEQGEGLATAGLWVGYIVSVLGILAIVFYVVVIVWAVNHSGTTT